VTIRDVEAHTAYRESDHIPSDVLGAKTREDIRRLWFGTDFGVLLTTVVSRGGHAAIVLRDHLLGLGMPLTGLCVTLRACARSLRTLTLGQNTRIWQSASQENARRELSRAEANFACVISGLQQTRISDQHAK
jgi:hypothetical protein